MPRVHSAVARAAKRSRSCARCGQPIEVGQSVFYWTRRNYPKQYQHQACGSPRPSQLYSRKTAIIEDELLDADFSFTEDLPVDAQPGDTFEIDISGVQSILESIADTAEGVGEEYEESADNLPEGLQQGYQAEAMRDIAERLREWADSLRYVDFDTTVDLRELEDDEDLEDWRVDMQSVIDDAINYISQTASDAIGDMPEYEG